MTDNIATRIAEALLRHNIDLMRLDAGTRVTVNRLLRSLAVRLARLITRFETLSSDNRIVQRRALRRLMEQVEAALAVTYSKIIDLTRDELIGVSELEIRTVVQTINTIMGVELVTGRMSSQLLRALASNALIEGAPSADWWRGQRNALKEGFLREMRAGIVAGEPVSELVRRVRGRREHRFQDGLMALHTRHAEALVRSSVLAVANLARQNLFEDNADVVKGMQWVSTLDSRTSDTCKALDGQAWYLDGRRMPGTRLAWRGPPPAHWSCRSTLVPVLRSWADLSKDPATRRRLRQAEADFPPGLRASMDGAVSADLNYEDWLRTKPESFQREVLGPTKLKLWQAGKLPFTKLVDQSHAPRTVAELKEAG